MSGMSARRSGLVVVIVDRCTVAITVIIIRIVIGIRVIVLLLMLLIHSLNVVDMIRGDPCERCGSSVISCYERIRALVW